METILESGILKKYKIRQTIFRKMIDVFDIQNFEGDFSKFKKITTQIKGLGITTCEKLWTIRDELKQFPNIHISSPDRKLSNIIDQPRDYLSTVIEYVEDPVTLMLLNKSWRQLVLKKEYKVDQSIVNILFKEHSVLNKNSVCLRHKFKVGKCNCSDINLQYMFFNSLSRRKNATIDNLINAGFSRKSYRFRGMNPRWVDILILKIKAANHINDCIVIKKKTKEVKKRKIILNYLNRKLKGYNIRGKLPEWLINKPDPINIEYFIGSLTFQVLDSRLKALSQNVFEDCCWLSHIPTPCDTMKPHVFKEPEYLDMALYSSTFQNAYTYLLEKAKCPVELLI